MVWANSSFISWDEIIPGVPLGSVLDPFLLSIFLDDLFLFPINSNVSNYADDNTLHASKWFYDNYMVLNQGKYHCMYLGRNTENETYF